MARIGARSSSTGSFHCALAVGGGWPRRLLAASPILIGVTGALAATAGQLAGILGNAGEVAVTAGAAGRWSGAIGWPADIVLPAAVMMSLLAAAPAAFIAWRRRRVRNLPASSTDPRVAEAGLLRISADGHIWWQADGRRASLPLQPLRWYAGRRVTWIHASASPGTARLQLLLWRTSADDAAWRKLQAWLVWRERGGSRT